MKIHKKMEYHHISWGGNIIHFMFFYVLPCSFATPTPHYPKINLVYTYNTNSKSEERDNWLDLLSLQYSGQIFIIIPLLYNKKKLVCICTYVFLLIVPLNQVGETFQFLRRFFLISKLFNFAWCLSLIQQ